MVTGFGLYLPLTSKNVAAMAGWRGSFTSEHFPEYLKRAGIFCCYRNPDLNFIKKLGQGNSPRPVCIITLLWAVSTRFHVVEYPVPHYQQAGDDHVSEQPCPKEGSREDEFGVHHPHPSAVTVSAQVSTLFRIASSVYEVRLTWSRLKLTK